MLMKPNSNNSYYVMSYLCSPMPLPVTYRACIPTGLFCESQKRLVWVQCRHVSLFIAFLKLHSANFPFMSREAYSLVMVIRICILRVLKILEKRSVITTLTAFIITHFSLFLYTVLLPTDFFYSLALWLSHSFKVSLRSNWCIFTLNILAPIA